jgi:hypothetical protein
VTLPHSWWRDPPQLGRHAWYRIQFPLDHVPSNGLSLYLPKLVVNDASVYVNRNLVWKLSESYASGVALSPLRIPVPAPMLQRGTNTLHLEVRASPQWFNGIPRIYVGDTNALSERAAIRGLLQGQMAVLVAAAFGTLGFLSLLLWHRSGRDPVLFWYGVSGVALLVATLSWYVTMWRPNFGEWRLGLIFLRHHGYLVPLFILHLRLAGRRNAWLESAAWLLLAAAFTSIVAPGPWRAGA